MCSFVDRCAEERENASLGAAIAMKSVGIWSGAVISNALNELDLVIVYANGRAICCASAIANVLETGCVMAFSFRGGKIRGGVKVARDRL